MSVLNKLKADVLAARKAQNFATLALLQTLIGEASKVAKDQRRDLNDADVSKTAEKFIKSVDQNIKLTGSNSESTAERDLYSRYVEADPFDGLDISEVIILLTDRGDPVNVGTVMKAGKGRFNVADVKAAL